jgi:integrase
MAAIDKSLPKATGRKKHHPALPYVDLPQFLSHLRERESMGRLALEFAILTAARSGEVRGMVWGELDLEAKQWTVPAERMKAKREHIVPLCAPALAILERMAAFRQVGSDLVFSGMKRGQPLSDMTLSKAVKDLHAAAIEMGGKGYLDRVTKVIATPHGFRSTFRDWTADKTTYPNEVCEMALAHTIGNQSEASYRRETMLEKRAKLMDAWGGYCSDSLVGNVVRITG